MRIASLLLNALVLPASGCITMTCTCECLTMSGTTNATGIACGSALDPAGVEKDAKNNVQFNCGQGFGVVQNCNCNSQNAVSCN